VLGVLIGVFKKIKPNHVNKEKIIQSVQIFFSLPCGDNSLDETNYNCIGAKNHVFGRKHDRDPYLVSLHCILGTYIDQVIGVGFTSAVRYHVAAVDIWHVNTSEICILLFTSFLCQNSNTLV
jgi:hypothetical protein